MAETSRKPKIRFVGFTEDWEQRKVGDLIEDYVERTTIQNQYPVLTSSQQQGIVLQEAYFADRQVTTNDNVGYFVLPKGYFTYRSRSDTDVFVFNRNDIISKGIISYYYPVFQTKYTCSDFLLRRLNHGIRKQLAMAAEGTGQKVLAHSKFKNMTVSVPKIGEQQKVGTFFRHLDHLITLHQRKRDRLGNIKKAMLEKMFPKNGADVPEVRFAGFTEAWEQRKFGDIVTPYADPVPTPTDGYYRLGMRSHAKGTFHNYVKPGMELGTAQMHRVAADKFIVNITFGWEHAVAITDENDAEKLVSHRFPQFSFNIGMVPDFFKFVIMDENFRHHLWLASPGGAGRNRVLKVNEMLEYKFWVPSADEQRRIAVFLENLDRLITLHQRKVQLLQNIKKACLEMMFV